MDRTELMGAYDRGERDFRKANLSDANLRNADLSGADLSNANLRNANLSDADLSDADLSGANLRNANLSRADLSKAYLTGADLSDADLSGAVGLIDPVDWITQLEHTPDGVIAYKAFGINFPAPDRWVIHAGAVISEVVNPLPTMDCACGVNVARHDWEGLPKTGVWKVLIRWDWLPSVVVPYNTDGKFRCGRCELVEQIN